MPIADLTVVREHFRLNLRAYQQNISYDRRIKTGFHKTSYMKSRDAQRNSTHGPILIFDLTGTGKSISEGRHSAYVHDPLWSPKERKLWGPATRFIQHKKLII